MQVPLNAQVNSSSEPSPTPERSQSGSMHTSSSNATPASPAAVDQSALLPEGTILPPEQNVSAFTAGHTTEDQASMDAIIEADNARRRRRHQWAYEESDRTNAHLLKAGHMPGLIAAAPPQTSAAEPSGTPAAITEGSSATLADGTASSTSQQPAQIQRFPSALVITLPDDGGAPRHRTRRAPPMPVLRSTHATTPSKSAIAAAKVMRAKAQVQAHVRANPQAALLHSAKSALYYPPSEHLPLSANERRLMSAGAPPQTIAAHTRFPSSSEAAHGGRAGSESPSPLASTPSGVYSESPASSSGVAEDGIVKANSTAAQSQHGGNAQGLHEVLASNVTQIGGGPRMGTVVTPSPAHMGVAAPIMTWGEVAGTPMVLDEDDLHGEEAAKGRVTPRGVLQGPRSVKETAADIARKELALSRVRNNRSWSQAYASLCLLPRCLHQDPLAHHQ
jgi:hypothetical protein